MRVYISVDMEGIAGISHPAPTDPGARGYDAAVDLTVGEVNAAVDGAFMGGATEVLVNDSHAGQWNLRPADVDPRARLLQGQKFWSMVGGAAPEPPENEPRFDVAFWVGYHVGAGHPTGNLAHTYGDRAMDVRLNGRSVSEVGLGAAVLAGWGIPTGLVSGDDALIEDAAVAVPSAEGVVIKQGFGTNAAASLHPSVAADRIRSASERAIRRAAAGELDLAAIETPITVDIDLQRPIEADLACWLPQTERTGPRSIRYTAPDAATMFRLFMASICLANYADA